MEVLSSLSSPFLFPSPSTPHPSEKRTRTREILFSSVKKDSSSSSSKKEEEKRRRRKKKENGGPIRDQKKKLSLILREEAAVLGVERKALGSAAKHINLWPKAVLESLDDSISNHRWESALKN